MTQDTRISKKNKLYGTLLDRWEGSGKSTFFDHAGSRYMKINDNEIVFIRLGDQSGFEKNYSSNVFNRGK